MGAFEKGDYSRIARIFNERHREDGQTVTPSYVRMIILRVVKNCSSQKSKEVNEIAASFIQSKIAATQNLVTI